MQWFRLGACNLGVVIKFTGNHPSDFRRCQDLRLLAVLTCCALAGCGAPAAPQPPSLQLPVPVLDLSATRSGNSVQLAWTMPTRTTDKVALHHPVTVGICRAVESGPCSEIANVPVEPGVEGTYKDDLPAPLTQGASRRLGYEVALKNHAGKSAGPSNAAYSAAGISPAALTGFTVQVRAAGVQLNWQPSPEAGTPVLFRIQRLLLTAPPQEQSHRSPLAESAPVADQTLVVHAAEGTDPGHAIDSSAQFNQQYKYVMERVATLTFGEHPVEVLGAPSEAIVIATTDTFPPAVPQGLAAVADAATGAIDLSWSPDEDIDVAGYGVFRRDINGPPAAQRIASLKLETSFRDSGVEPGHGYAYSLSAIDQSGNESQRSPEVEETLPSR